MLSIDLALLQMTSLSCLSKSDQRGVGAGGGSSGVKGILSFLSEKLKKWI